MRIGKEIKKVKSPRRHVRKATKRERIPVNWPAPKKVEKEIENVLSEM